MLNNDEGVLNKVKLIAGISSANSGASEERSGKIAAGLILCGVAVWMLTASAKAGENAKGSQQQAGGRNNITIEASEEGDGNHGGNGTGPETSGGGAGPNESLLNLTPLPIAQAMPFKILVAEQPSSTVKAKYASHKAGDILVIYTQDIDPTNVGSFTAQGQQKLKAQLDGYMPEIQSKGMVVLDWEGTGYQRLVENPGSPMQQTTMQEYIKATQYVRQLRPQARVSVYGVPMSKYWGRDDTWVAAAESLKPLIQQLDYLCPSIYDYYATAQDPAFTQMDKDYAKDNAHLALQMAEGRPVYPFVWPRFHDSNANWALRLVPSSEFKGMVKAMAQAEVEGRYINGVVWWGSDKSMRWLYHHPPEESDPSYAHYKLVKKVFKKEIPSDVTESKFFNDMQIRVLKDLKSALATIPEPPAE